MYGLFRKGGSIGEQNDPNKPIETSECRSALMDKACSWNSMRTPGEKEYYKIKYTVRKIKEQ